MTARVSQTVPLIYSPTFAPIRVSLGMRLTALAVAAGCTLLLLVAAGLEPSRSGVGTHQGLRLDACQFLQRTGLPCMSCGMTTSFTWFVRGNVMAAFYVQPMGALLAIVTVIAIWSGLYIAVTGRPALRLLRYLPDKPYVLILLLLATGAWAWKIFIHLRGIDGWH